jgi:hypothetical protein
MCWNASSSERSNPSKRHRFLAEGVQPTIRPIPGTNNSWPSSPNRITASALLSYELYRVIVEALKVAQGLLCQNLPPTHNLTDAAAVLRLRELMRSPSIQSALERSSDTLIAFAFRAVERVLCDHSRPHRETINLLWDVLDDAHLNKALGLPPNTFGPYLSRR